MARHKRERRGREKREIFLCSLKKGCSDLPCSGLTFDAPAFHLAFCFFFFCCDFRHKGDFVLTEKGQYSVIWVMLWRWRKWNYFFVSLHHTPRPPSRPFMTAFKGSAAAHGWISNQPTGQWNYGNSWESLWVRGLSQDHFLSVWFRDAQGCSSFSPRHLGLGLSVKSVSLCGSGLNSPSGARGLIVFVIDQGPNMNMHIH